MQPGQARAAIVKPIMATANRMGSRQPQPQVKKQVDPQQFFKITPLSDKFYDTGSSDILS